MGGQAVVPRVLVRIVAMYCTCIQVLHGSGYGRSRSKNQQWTAKTILHAILVECRGAARAGLRDSSCYKRVIALLSSGVPARVSALSMSRAVRPGREKMLEPTVWCDPVLRENTIMADQSRLVERAPLNCPRFASASRPCQRYRPWLAASTDTATGTKVSPDSHNTPDLLDAGLVQAHASLAAALRDITLL